MIRLKVNGGERQVGGGRKAQPLLGVLREDLGLLGTKYGCGVGSCGACTVLLGGQPVSSCQLLLGQIGDREVLTIEGLGQGGALHPVQRAFIDHGAFQCAYCTPGFVLSTVALLSEVPAPTEAQARDYLSGNLCRCGSYKNIMKAVMSLSRPRGTDYGR